MPPESPRPEEILHSQNTKRAHNSTEQVSFKIPNKKSPLFITTIVVNTL